MKYYITCGSLQNTIHAGNPYQACMKVFKTYFDTYRDVVPKAFRVSQQGFDTHKNDEVIETTTIIKLMELSNQCPLGKDEEII